MAQEKEYNNGINDTLALWAIIERRTQMIKSWKG